MIWKYGHESFAPGGAVKYFFGKNEYQYALQIVPIQFEDANLEIMARIVKAASHKHNCDVEIDFSNGVRKAIFTGVEEMKAYIAAEVLDILNPKKEIHVVSSNA